MTFDLLDLPLIIGVAFSLWMVARVYNESERQSMASIALILALSISAWQLFVFSLIFSGNIVKLPHLGYTGFPTEFLIGPLFYLHSVSRFLGRQRFKWTDGLHVLPFLGTLYAFKDFYFFSAEKKIRIFSSMSAEPMSLPLFWLLILIAALLTKAVYFALYFKNLRHFELLAANRTANSALLQSLSNYRKLTWMYVGYIALLACLFLYLSFATLYGLYADYAWYLLKSVWIIAFALFALNSNKQTVDSAPITAASLEIEAPTEIETPTRSSAPARKYAKSGLNEALLESLKSKLTDYMVRKKPHLDSELSLASLAKQLDTHPNHVSQIINQSFDQTFSDFINRYRIEYAKELLSKAEQEDSLNILEVAFESGFNSRTSFNRCFKKETAQTPSQFRANTSLESV